jgi:hypothetical protein
MASDLAFSYANLSPLISAWSAHYEARGCSPEKARRVAMDRVQRKRTWPCVGLGR